MGEVCEGGPRQRGEVTVVALDVTGQHLDVGGDGFGDDRSKEVFLGFEVQVERALRDARATGDVVQARGGEALLDENRESRRDDLAGPLTLATTPARCVCRMQLTILITDWSVIYSVSDACAQAAQRRYAGC